MSIPPRHFSCKRYLILGSSGVRCMHSHSPSDVSLHQDCISSKEPWLNPGEGLLFSSPQQGSLPSPSCLLHELPEGKHGQGLHAVCQQSLATEEIGNYSNWPRLCYFPLGKTGTEDLHYGPYLLTLSSLLAALLRPQQWARQAAWQLSTLVFCCFFLMWVLRLRLGSLYLQSSTLLMEHLFLYLLKNILWPDLVMINNSDKNIHKQLFCGHNFSAKCPEAWLMALKHDS